MSDDICNICGDLKNDKYIHKLQCGHEFHYECILKTFLSSTNKLCPLCRSLENDLPIVNGLKKIYPNIHYKVGQKVEHNNIPCKHILKTGKNKGNHCNNKCKVGYMYCGKHVPKLPAS